MVVVMVVVIQVTSGTYLSTPNQDLLSAFTWAALELPSVGVDLLTPTEGLPLTPLQKLKVAGKQRKRRQLLTLFPEKDKMPVLIEVRLNYFVKLIYIRVFFIYLLLIIFQ